MTDLPLPEPVDPWERAVFYGSYPDQLHAYAAAKTAELEAELKGAHAEIGLLTHKVITCGVAAIHPNAALASTGAYAGKWDSPQAQSVRKLRAERDTLQAECTRLRSLIEEHNADCIARCGDKKQCGYAKYTRRCPTCPVDDCIELDAALSGKETK